MLGSFSGQLAMANLDPHRPRVELWTDGSGTITGEPGGWAYILRAKKDGEWVERVKSGADESCTNNRMELTALLEGLRALRRPAHVTVFTDSEYVAKPFTVGYIAKWQQRGYSKIKNPDLWKAIVRAAAMHRLEFRWVRGHSGVELNERCDKLAGEERMKLIALMAEEESELFAMPEVFADA